MTTVASVQRDENLLLLTGLPAKASAQAGGRIANDYATDPLARLTGTWLLNSAQQTLNYHGYEHNLRNDITRHTRTDSSFVDYDYDDLGQLTDAVGSGGQSVELLVYGYDTGWNMTGDGTTGYFVNDRNQVTSDTSGAYVSYTYDAHGNRTSKTTGVGYNNLYYTYDAENRLTRVEQPYWGYPPVQRTEFVYDGLSRLRIRKEYQYTGSNWQWTGETRYIYDGRRVIQERSSANTPTVTYTLGSDLSGSLEGAGGIGGMLARSHGYSGSTGNWSTHNYYHADAGGNITCLINASQSITASYRYDPFGRTLFQSGTMANANVYRFSSKEVHGFTGMYYYGFRFYDPGLQRWINRDPLGDIACLPLIAAAIAPKVQDENFIKWIVEFRAVNNTLAGTAFLTDWSRVNMNLYGSLDNDPLNQVDPFGLDANSYADCIEQYRNPITEQLPNAIVGGLGSKRRVPGWVPPAAHGANALGNKLVGPTGRTGVGGLKSHPTTWQHKLGSKLGSTGSKIGRFLGRAAVVLTVAEGFFDIGLLAGCGIAEAID